MDTEKVELFVNFLFQKIAICDRMVLYPCVHEYTLSNFPPNEKRCIS